MRPSRLSSALSSLCTRWKAWGRVPPFAAPERLCICSMTGTEGESLPKQAKFASRLQVKKLSEHAVLPTRGSAGAAGDSLAPFEKECPLSVLAFPSRRQPQLQPDSRAQPTIRSVAAPAVQATTCPRPRTASSPPVEGVS